MSGVDESSEDREYRNLLISLAQKSIESYDKTVLSLSGGALGVSFAFVSDFIGDNKILSPFCLVSSWTSWGASITFVLFSFYFSHLALREAVDQFDAGERDPQKLGGNFDKITRFLNVSAGLLFLVGVILLAIFIYTNIRG